MIFNRTSYIFPFIFIINIGIVRYFSTNLFYTFYLSQLFYTCFFVSFLDFFQFFSHPLFLHFRMYMLCTHSLNENHRKFNMTKFMNSKLISLNSSNQLRILEYIKGNLPFPPICYCCAFYFYIITQYYFYRINIYHYLCYS